MKRSVGPSCVPLFPIVRLHFYGGFELAEVVGVVGCDAHRERRRMLAAEFAGGDFEQEMIPAFLERQALELVARAVIGRFLAGRWYFAAVEEQPAFLGGVTERGELRRVGAVRQQVVECGGLRSQQLK